MKRKEIEKRLYSAISNSVPDIEANILAKCQNKEGIERMVEKKKNVKKTKKIEKNKNVFIPRLAMSFGVIAVCALGLLGVNRYNKFYKTDSIVNFDVNPSVELKINSEEKIIEALAHNEDGKKVLDGMDLNKVDVDVAVNALIGSMLKNGYISTLENSILVSVKNDDLEKAKKLEKEISDDINALLTASAIEGSILSQSYDNNNEAKKLANENKISEGKAILINKILEAGLKNSKGEVYTFDSLAKLSINELNVLLHNKEAKVKNTTTSGKVSEGNYIGKGNAKKIAYEDAKVTSSNVKNVYVELDADDGRLVYEVEFDAIGYEYEYEIDAKTGDIINKEKETDDDYKAPTTSSSSNKGNGSSSGNGNGSGNSSSSSSSNSTYIGKNKAKQIAFGDAGVTSSSAKDVEVELDKENGVYVYEVSFETSTTEYDYVINAKTGKIIEKEKERKDDDD